MRVESEAGRALARVAVVVVGFASAAQADDAAWEELAAAREGLAMASPLAANFVQTYVPAGFDSGDEESGRLFLSLPNCLRWDYEEPYPRRYLLCGQTVWAWSPDEPLGDRYLSVSREEAGLDFMLLSVERLRQRYEAVLVAAEDGSWVIELTPPSPETPFARAAITLDPESHRPARLEYADWEGNETRFDLTLYRPLEATSPFLPPEEIEWVDAQ